MKILQVNCVYGEKSTGKLVRVLHEGALAEGYDSWVAYGRGSDCDSKNVFRLCSNFYGKLNGLQAKLTGLPYGGCICSTTRLIHWIKRETPDVVHLHCINGHFVNIYRLLAWLKHNQIPTVLTLHAEFIHTANCSHAFDCNGYLTGCQHCPYPKRATKSLLFHRTAESWKKMYAALEGFGDRLTVVSVSDWLSQRAQKAPILQSFTHQTVLNGVDTQTFRLLSPAVSSCKIVLHVTADFDDTKGHPKGAYYVLELAKRMEGSNVRFLVAAGHQNLHGEIPSNVELLGAVTDQNKLAELYAMSDVTLLTSRRETFSMPCAESLCCGTPVVGFCAGAPEQISLPQYSKFVQHGDIDALQTALEDALDTQWEKEKMAANAAAVYSVHTMLKAYLCLYNKMKEND